MVFKCKMCGGDLNPAEGSTTVECDFCGTMQTIANADNEKKANLFNRANRLRMVSEFDRAAGVYESIVSEFPEEAEAYWGLCLCAYGIEYVTDPASGRKIPTCHRTVPESIMESSNFEMACEYADGVAHKLYREEAKAIDRLQKDILAIVANEAPYDVFICYKETDEGGSRTADSVLGQDIYDALTTKGMKVFFARISLEDKLGQQYEPYIYAALHSAKVMIAIGTSFENYNSVWVKNEWSRFIDMASRDKTKVLIPCYKDIDAYDIPKEFRNLQAQDMNKLGWLQDLTRGVAKLCEKEAADNSAAGQPPKAVPETKALLKRVFIFLEEQSWQEADTYCEKVLDNDPENANAYLGKLMAELKVSVRKELGNQSEVFDDNKNFQKALRYAEPELATELNGYNSAVSYRNADRAIRAAFEEREIDAAIALMQKCSGYLDADEIVSTAKEKWQANKERFDVLIRRYRDLSSKHPNETPEARLRHSLCALNSEKQRLEELRSNLPEINLTLNENKAKIKEKQASIASLKSKREGLGLFAGKQKKEIDNSIFAIQEEIEALSKTIVQLDIRLGRYSTVAKVDDALEEINASIAKTENELQALTENLPETIDAVLEELASDEYHFWLEKATEIKKLPAKWLTYRRENCKTFPISLTKAESAVDSWIISEWCKEVGERIEVGNALFCYESGKAAFEYISPHGGILLEKCFEAGDKCHTGDIIYIIG